MPELVRHDPQRLPVRCGQPGVCGGLLQCSPQAAGDDAPAALGEDEVRVAAQARVGQRPLRAAVADQGVQAGQRAVIEGDGAFGGELAERDAQPASGGP